MKQLLINFSSLSLDNGSRINQDWIGNVPTWSRKIFALVIVLLLGVGQMWGYTETLNSTKITTNITNSTQCAYGTPRSAYTDGDVTYTACCNTDAAGRPWMQLRAKNDAYITISLPSTKKITNVSVTISNTTNEKGGVTDISKHGNFNGEVVLRSSISNTPGTSPDFTSGSVNAKSASVDVTGSNNTLHLQVTAAARIWGIVVTYQDNASCTSNATVSASSNSSVLSRTATVSCTSGISSLGSAGCSISSYGFVIGSSANPSIGDDGVTKHEVGTSYTTTGTSFSKDLTGLTPGATYYVRSYATNGNGSGYGTQTSFTMLNEYTLTFKEWDGGGAASGSPSTGTVVQNATSFSFGATAPTKTGHTIEGFYTNTSASSGVKVANSSRQFVASVTDWTDGSSKYTKDANANLYIKWQAKQAAITFDKNDGTGGDNGTTATYGSAMPTVTVPTRTGYDFDGYYDAETDDNGSGNKYYNSDGTSAANWNKDTEAATTLYAKWTEKTLNITWSVNGSSWSEGTPSPSVTYGSKIATFPTSPTKGACDGSKEFVGWTLTPIVGTTNTKPTFVSPQTTITETGDFTLYAVFATRTANNFTKGDINDLINGKEVIIHNAGRNYALSSSGSSGRLTAESVTPSNFVISSSEASIRWTVQNNGATYYFKNSTNYLYASDNDNTKLFCGATSDYWTIGSYNSAYYLYSNTSTSSYKLEAYYSNTNGAFFTTYSQSSSSPGADYQMQFYVPTYSAYQTACCTQYNVTLASSGSVTGGTFETDKAKACEGTTVTLTATPSANYRFNSWTISKAAGTVSPADASSASTTFTMPGEAVTVTASFTAKCQTPTFSVSAGTYNNDQTVTISCATSSATIKYTTDGSDPATYGTTYSTPVTINADNTTLKAVAIKAGHENSEVASATYRLKCATPTFTASPGLQNSKYLGTQTVTLATTTTGSITYYYTTGATPADPTKSSTEYEDGIEVSSSTTVKAIATKSGYQNSDVGSASYTITAAHTVTWMNQNDAVTPLKTERVENGAAPAAFPTESKSGCSPYTTFYGWAEDNFTTPVTNPNSSSTIKVYRSASELPNSSSDVTYYAVWADAAPGWSKASSVSAGDVVILVCESQTKEMNGWSSATSSASGYGTCTSYSTSPTGAYSITVVASATDGYVKFHTTYDNKDYYLTATSSNNLYLTNDTENDNQLWAITFDNGDARIKNKGQSTRYIRCNTANSPNRFAAYGSSDTYPYGTQNAVQLYKYSDVNCVTKCCTPLDDINGDKTDLEYNSVTLTWDDIDHVTAWTVTGVDGSSVAVPAGNIGTPTDEGSTYSCAITGLSQYTDYTFTITPTPADGYCDASDEVTFKTPCVAPSSLSIAATGSKWDYCAGESMTLTVSGTNVSASATYQWQKHNGSAWVDIDGANSASYTVASMAASNAGQYRCTVTNPGSSCDATTDGAWVRLWQLHLGDDNIDFTNTGTGTGSNTAVYLNSDTHYEFKLIDNNGGWFGLNSKTVTTNESNITLNGTGANVNVTSGLEGNYTFAIDYASSGTKDNPKVSITYPVGNQPAGRKIWFDKSVITGWTDADASQLYWRIGKKANSMVNTDETANYFTLVPGTDRFYEYTTKEYNGFEAWQVANNTAWSGNSDNNPDYDNHSIYTHYHNQNSTDVKYGTVYQKYVIGTSGVTLVPTTKKNTDWYCDFWYVDKYDGMLTHNASITAYSHGTVTVSYTNTSSVASSFTSGNADLAHRCILTITAVPDAGYSLTSLQVNSADFDSGDEHILSADATITAVFTPQTSTVTLKPNGGSGSDQTVTATYDVSMPGTLSGGGDIVKPSRDHYSFTGYFDNTSGGTQYYTNTLASAKIWDKTGAQNLYAQWQGDSYTITFKDKGNNAYSGSNGGSLPTSHTYGTATALVDGVKTGYHFDGWYTDASCTAGNEITSIGATAITVNTTYYAKWTIENYSVTWKVNGENYTTGTPSDNADYNTKVSTLPTAPSAPEGCSDKVFKGWSASNLGKTTGQSAPADLFTTAEGSPAITANTIFYAVFADETPESTITTWTKMSSGSVSESGTYAIIGNNNKAFNGSATGHGGTTSDAFSFTENVATSAPTGTCELTITRIAANHFVISKVEVEEEVSTTYYLYAKQASSGGLVWRTTAEVDGVDGTYYWYNSDSGGPWRYSKEYSTKYAYLRDYGSGDQFRTYGDKSYNDVAFARKGTAITPASYSNYVTECDEPAECGTPTFSVEEGTYTETQTVTISTVTDGATIRYTTDGTDPTSSSGTVYSEPVEVSCTTTLKAIAVKDGRDDSDVGSVDITIKVPNPTFSINSGTYYSVQNVTLSCDMDGATIYYETTNDGTDPTTPTSSSTEYTGAINIPANSTIKVSAIAIKDGCATASDVVTKTYVVRIGTDYTLVTDVNDLNAGDKVVIIANTGDKHAINTYTAGANRPSTSDFDINGEKTVATIYPLKVGDTYTVQVLDLDGEPGAWVLKSGTSYLGLKADDSQLRTYVGNTTNETKWTISISSNLATITNKEYTGRSIQLNSSGSPFACYANGSQTAVKLYSVPTTDPVIKVEASLSAFTSCAGNAGTYQSFYVSGKNLTGNMVISGPTGYEFCSTSGGTYTSTLTLTPSTGTVARQLVYVRLAASATSGAHNGNINVAVSANSLSKNVAITGSATTSDAYVDRIHGNSSTYYCGSYDAPSLTDETEETSGTCAEVHYKFLGWVAESDLSSLTSDGAYKSVLVEAGDDMTADGTTYYAVWGELE